MPIIEIEDQLLDKGVLGNLPRLGKLRKGASKEQLKDLDYFRATFENKQYEELLLDPFKDLYGSEPDTFHGVLLAGNSANEAFDYWYENWAHARLVTRCDGESVVLSSDKEGKYSAEHHACTCTPVNHPCKQHGRLDIVLPDLCKLTGVWGKFTIETGSIYDVVALRGYMLTADAFLAALPNVNFWSVPFTVGRAVRDVPVTINGKRSIKPMSLLYAMIEPEFNRAVMTPQLTAPAQRLLESVNPETGEVPIPEIEIEQPEQWDWDYVKEQTLHLFEDSGSGAHRHQENVLKKMMNADELTPDMTDAEAIHVITENRKRRQAEKSAGNEPDEPLSNADETHWAKTADAVNLVKKAVTELKLNHGQVIKALSRISPEGITSIEQFTGSKEEAWAACIAYKCDYDDKLIGKYAKAGGELYQAVSRTIEAHQIPF